MENSATRRTDKRRTRRGLALREAAVSLDGVSLFDIVPTVTDLPRESVWPLRATRHNTEFPFFWSEAMMPSAGQRETNPTPILAEESQKSDFCQSERVTPNRRNPLPRQCRREDLNLHGHG